MAFARHQFELSAPQEDGQTLLAHLQAVEERTGKVHSMIANAPQLPEGLSCLWTAFLALHECRGSNGFGASRISFADIDCFQRVTGTRLQPWEVEWVRKADNLWLSEFAPKPKGDK